MSVYTHNLFPLYTYTQDNEVIQASKYIFWIRHGIRSVSLFVLREFIPVPRMLLLLTISSH